MDPSEPDESLLHENSFPDGSVEARLYAAIAQSRVPTTVSELAAQTDCESLIVHECLQSFVSLDVVIEHDSSPPTYERNDAFFEWDTVKSLARDHSLTEIEEQMTELLDRIETFQDRYDADTPGAVDPRTTASETTFADDVAKWEAARAELRRLERARQIRLSRSDSTYFESGDLYQ